jgi:hypothetical protein
VNARDKNFTQAKMKRRLERIDESIARYLSQLETADRQAAAGADVPAAKVTRLKDKLAKLKEEIAASTRSMPSLPREPGQASFTDRSGCAFDGDERQGHRDCWLQRAGRRRYRAPSHCRP